VVLPIIGQKDLRLGGDKRLFSRARDFLHVPWPVRWPYRLFDERAKELGPYYVTLGGGRPSERHPILTFQFGLEQHARWKRTGNEKSRELFLGQAQWAATAQRETLGVRGSYEVRSAMAQGKAISLLLRAYQETGNAMFMERAVDASVPLTIDLRDGGVLWQSEDDLIFEGVVAGALPSHVLRGWICALWGTFELSRTANLTSIAQLYRQSLTTLQKYLPRYDSGTWSYENLLVMPTGIRRVTSLQQHLLHVAQLNVLLSMTRNKQFAVVAERWHRYAASASKRVQAWVSGLIPGVV
jgi:heparosan-N-sulfate-glucuronate 5-epimerase